MLHKPMLPSETTTAGRSRPHDSATKHVAGAALYVEFTFEPPIWVHIVLWGPLALVVCLGLLRLMKGVLVALQYTNKAAEGRLEE